MTTCPGLTGLWYACPSLDPAKAAAEANLVSFVTAAGVIAILGALALIALILTWVVFGGSDR